jgi:predicted dehydrogenase
VLRVAIIGCGWAARALHVPALRRSRVGQVVAASDPLEHARAAVSPRRHFGDWRDMIASVACDAVLVATPPDLHAAAVLAALAAGRHVLVEKPVAVTLGDARRIADAARHSGRTVVVGFNQRHHADFRALRHRIARRAPGTPASVHVRWSTGAGLGTRPWIGSRSTGGGAIADLGSHVFDLWRFLTDDEFAVTDVHSTSVTIDDERATIAARTRGGVGLSADLSLVGEDRFDVELRLDGARDVVRPYGRAFQRSYDDLWRAFAAAVRGDESPVATVEDGVASLACVLAATRGLPAVPITAPAPAPRLPFSVIASTTVGYRAIRTTVAHVRRQTVVSDIELVMVGPTEASLAAPDDETCGFGAVQRVAVGPVQSIAHANAAGVRRASGRIVALTEDHCFPEPGWAAALVVAHRDDVAVVGPVVENANPGTAVSEADFVIGYGPWMAPMQAREMAFLPGHNSSYKRDDLLALGGRLERMLEAETVLHMEWAARGLRLRVEPAARARHVNYSRWASWLPVQFLAGRLFAGQRAAAWPRRRRWFYAAASPLIPAVRFWRCAAEFRRPGRRAGRLWRIAPALAIGLALDGAGQCLGYLAGPGDAMVRLARYEFNRIDHVRAEERGLWTSP